jgi:sterol 14alpha-demethylase
MQQELEGSQKVHLELIFLILAYGYHILLLLNGGHTNQTTTFVWSLLHSLRSPNLLKSIREQKTDHLLNVTFRETGRLYTNLIILRRVTIPQVIMGKHIPQGTFVACSPVATARDPSLFPNPDKFDPTRWLTPTNELDEVHIKNVQRIGSSVQFGKGQHACLGEKIGKTIVMDVLWGAFLGNEKESGFDIEILGGLKEGVGIDNVGIEAAFAEENLGTPFERGGPVMVKFKKLAVS